MKLYQKTTIYVVLFFSVVQLFAQQNDKIKGYIAVQERYTFWNEDRTWGQVNFNPELYTKVDFSARLFKFLRIGGILGLSNNDKKIVNYSLNLGIKKLGVSIERGDISGNFELGRFVELNYTDEERMFDFDFTQISVYQNMLNGAAKIGLQYTDFGMPLDTEVNYKSFVQGYESEKSIVYVDPNGKFKLYGLFASVDMLVNALDMGSFLFGGGKTGFILGTETTLGYAEITPSNFKQEEINQIITTETGQASAVTLRTRGLFGFKSSTHLGYGFVTNRDKLNFALAAGYEYNLIGGLSFADPESFNEIISKTEDFNYHGPFVRLITAW